MNKHERSVFEAMVKEVAQNINPATAEVEWVHRNTSDPYGIYPKEENICIGRVCFARCPGSDVWVWFGDLPDTTREALWKMHGHKLAFPAGILDPSVGWLKPAGEDPEDFWESIWVVPPPQD